MLLAHVVLVGVLQRGEWNVADVAVQRVRPGGPALRGRPLGHGLAGARRPLRQPRGYLLLVVLRLVVHLGRDRRVQLGRAELAAQRLYQLQQLRGQSVVAAHGPLSAGRHWRRAVARLSHCGAGSRQRRWRRRRAAENDRRQ